MGRLSLKTVIWAAAALAAASGCVPALTPPQWSVDSKRVLFIHRTGSPAGALYIVELGEELSHPTRLPSEGDAKVSAVAWSADGTRVYYAACGAEGARLRKCRPDGSEDVEIAEFPGEELRWIAASTDGREVFALAAEANEPGGEIVAVDLATGRLGVLEGAPRGCLSAAMLDTAGKEILCATAVEAGGTRQAAVWRI